jgi:transposase
VRPIPAPNGPSGSNACCAIAVRDRLANGEISTHGATVARGHLISRLLDLLAAPSAIVDCQRLAAHLTREFDALFGLLFDPTVEATNWRAEQALRPAVVNRKVSGGNRSAYGAQTQQILSSVIQTARLRHLEARDVVVDLLRTPRPTISPTLAALQ